MTEAPSSSPRYRRHLAVLAAAWLLWALLWLLPEPAAWRAPHRGWETALVSGVVDERAEIHARAAPFAPRSSWVGTATGDLSYLFDMPGADRPRAQSFHTDEYGFRNPPGLTDEPVDVVVVGNSFAVGSSVGDDDNLTGRLRQLGVSAYNAGGLDLQSFVQDSRWRAAPPRWVVHYVDEASVLPPLVDVDQPALELPAFATRQDYEEWVTRAVAEAAPPEPAAPTTAPPTWLAWLPGNRAQAALKAKLAARETALVGAFAYLVPRATHALGLPGFYDPALLHFDAESGQIFYRPSAGRYLDPAALELALQSVDALAATFRSASDLLASRGTRLIVLVCPNKELVYGDLVPALADVDTGCVLRRLDERLATLGVAHVDAWAICERARREQPDAPLFFPDDTHPTPRLQDLLARDVARLVAER